MKKLLVVAAIAAGLVGMAVVASAATPITNTCTSTYQITGQSVGASGWDTAIVRVLSAPDIQVFKWAKNVRTGIEDANQVNAVIGDSIEFRITFVNIGEADADTVVLRDYVPTGWVAGSVQSNTVTATASVNAGQTSFSATLLTATYNAVQGTDSASADNGQIKFTMRVQ